MKHLFVLVLVLFGLDSFAQKENSKELSFEPTFRKFNQVGLITNRSLINFIDNPALTGFDRKLSIHYNYQTRDLNLQDDFELGKSPFRYQTHSALIDIAFGKRQNWGAGIGYQHVKDGIYGYHLLTHAHSYRLLMEDHQLIFGVSQGLMVSSLNWNSISFGDMIDPRFGFVYATNEARPPSQKQAKVFWILGLRYSWKRLSFDYAFHIGPWAQYSFTTGVGGLGLTHRFKMAYHIKLDKNVNLTPELYLSNDYMSIWRFTPSISVEYKNMVFGQFMVKSLNQFELLIGYQYNDLIALTLGTATYFSKETSEITGLASAQIGLKLQLKTRKE